MIQKRFLTYALCMLVALTFSCSTDDIVADTDEDTTGTVDVDIPDDSGDTGDDDLDNNSQAVNYENSISIAFSGDEVTIDNPYTGVTVTNNGAHVVITSTVTDTELNYILSGTTEDGSVKIYGEYKFGLVLNGAGITNPAGAAINIQCGKKITVTVVDATENRLIDGETYTYTDGEDMKATFFSEGQLNFYGNGTLEVRGKNKHAICTDDYFRVYEGNIWVKEAASDAIHANDYIQIDGGTLTTRSTGEGFDCEDGYVEINGGTIEIVTTGQKGHGIKTALYTTVNSTGSLNIITYGAGSKAINTTGDMTLTAGEVTLSTTGDAFWEAEDNDITSAAGIKCDANVRIDGGTLTIASTGAGGKGINADGTLTINSGTVTVTTTGDQYVYDSSNDTAAKAIKSDGDLTINGGTIRINTTKTEAEGLESKASLYITGGDIEVVAYDDCINATSHIGISGGKIYCNSQTNDGIDSNGTLAVSGGTVISIGSAQPEEGFDCDQNNFAITGGTLIGFGGATSTPTASSCTQYSLIYGGSNVEIIHIESTSGGDEIVTFKVPKTLQGTNTLLISSPQLMKETGYTVYTGGSISGGESYHGLYTGATYSKGTSAGTFTTSSMVSSVGSVNGKR